ncbi:MAG: PHP domain-containing protein, partial [Clostridia bacterium]|nr:PHP domain-containing protein [Clostridia bacterium]
MKKYLLPEKGNYYKANLHSHSNLSDGKLSPEEMKALYKKRGYSVLAYTDHDMLIPHHDLTDEDFLALSGYEVEINQDGSPLKKSDKSCHICFIAKSPDIDIQPCWNEKYAHIGNAKINKDRVKYDKSLPPYERIYTPQCINDMIKKGRDAGFFVTYNHPVWSLENPEDYLKYEGINAMEILNYGCEVIGYNSYVPNIYNEMLRSGKKVFAVAADDNHNKFPEESPYCDSCGGFVMIKADSLKYGKITDALFKGN